MPYLPGPTLPLSHPRNTPRGADGKRPLPEGGRALAGTRSGHASQEASTPAETAGVWSRVCRL